MIGAPASEEPSLPAPRHRHRSDRRGCQHNPLQTVATQSSFALWLIRLKGYVGAVDPPPRDAIYEAPLTDEHLEIADGYEDASVEVQGSCRVWLAVVDTRTEPDAITERLGLVPTCTLRKGSPVSYLPTAVPGPVVKANRWEILVPVATDQDLDEHLKVLEGIMSQDVITV
jgi:hypothetical protein